MFPSRKDPLSTNELNAIGVQCRGGGVVTKPWGYGNQNPLAYRKWMSASIGDEFSFVCTCFGVGWTRHRMAIKPTPHPNFKEYQGKAID